MGDDRGATTICPVRFLEGGRMFTDAGRAAFGSGRTIVVAPEMRILHVPRTGKRIGKIDFVIAALDADGHATDFAALEVQSVYISGHSIRPAFNEYIATGKYAAVQRNRPDYRSSAQKRLMPQLSLKVPVFRRWGKKFFVVVDAAFYAAMPPIREVTTAENSEVTWLVYPLPRTSGGCGYTLGEPRVVFTQWDDVLSALREGEAPAQSEVLAEIETKLPRLQQFRT